MHNFGKFSPVFLDKLGAYQKWVTTRPEFVKSDALKNRITSCPDLQLQFGPTTETVPLRDLIQGFRDDSPANPLVRLMQLCHGDASGMDKRSDQKEKTARRWDPDLRSQIGANYPRCSLTSFGFAKAGFQDEDEVWAAQAVAAQRACDLFDAMTTGTGRRQAIDALQAALNPASAETQFPILDVRVSDMGFMVAAMLKATVVEQFLSAQPRDVQDIQWRDVKDIQWRLLRFAVDIPAFASRAVRMADVIVRRKLLEDSLDALRLHLEEDIGFCNQVYRDEYGSVFLIPQEPDWDAEIDWLISQFWKTLLAGQEANYSVLRSDAFGKGNNKGYSHQLGRLLAQPAPAPFPDRQTMQLAWNAATNAEVCPTCQVRPVARQGTAHIRHSCEECIHRREGRVKDWLAKQKGTMWLDEVIDQYGRIAVLSAELDLESWLLDSDADPRTHLVRTCFLERPRPEQDSNIPPATARIRRLTESARELWRDAESRIQRELGKSPARMVLEVPPGRNLGLSQNLNYDLVLLSRRTRISAVWDGNRFILTQNPSWIDPAKPFQSGDFEINEPTGYGSPDKTIVKHIHLKRAPDWGQPFHPYLRLQLDPRRFQCVVPAHKALALAADLETLFADRMARVRNRMGFRFSLIYADSAIPLRAVLDAARRAQASPSPAVHHPRTVASVFMEQANGVPYRIHLQFDNGSALRVPVAFKFPSSYVKKGVSRDPRAITPDDYYPYFETAAGPILHASQLKPGDQVRMARAAFDYEFLDSASRRFEIAYDGEGKRRASSFASTGRPYPAPAVHQLRNIAALLASRVSRRQMKSLDGLLAAKQCEWSDPRVGRAEVPASFVAAVIANLELLPRCEPFTAAETEMLCKSYAEGLLHDALEIYLGIEKGGAEDEKEEKE